MNAMITRIATTKSTTLCLLLGAALLLGASATAQTDRWSSAWNVETEFQTGRLTLDPRTDRDGNEVVDLTLVLNDRRTGREAYRFTLPGLLKSELRKTELVALMSGNRGSDGSRWSCRVTLVRFQGQGIAYGFIQSGPGTAGHRADQRKQAMKATRVR